MRNKKLSGLKFKRQYSIDHFVVDFYCSELKLAIELDGKIHLKKEIKNHDENRDGYLSEFGIKILRIKNEVILSDIGKVLKIISGKIEEIRKMLTSPKSSPLPTGRQVSKERTFKKEASLSFIRRGTKGEVNYKKEGGERLTIVKNGRVK